MQAPGQLWCCLIALLFGAATGLPAAELPFPVPQADHLDRYMKDALAYVNKNPESPHTPRVLLDMLMVFTASKKENDRDKVRRMLIARYPDTLEGRFAVSLFKDADEYRTTLLKMFNDDEVQGSRTGFGKGFLPRAMVGMKTFDADIFKHPEFLTRSIFAAEETGEVRLKDRLLRMLRAEQVGSKHEKEIMRLAFDNDLDHVAKIRAIHEKKDCGTKKFLTSYLMSRLDEAERNDLPIQKILIASKLKSAAWTEANRLIDRLNTENVAGDDRAQLRFWKGWALAADGNPDEADKTLALLAGDHPKSEWSKSAQALRQALSTKTASLEQNVRSLESAIRDLGDDIEVLELDLNWETSADITLSVYFSYQKKENAVQLFVGKNGRTHLAYAFHPQRSRMYTGADRTTLVGEGSMPIFTPEFKVNETEDGNLNFSVQTKSADSLEAGKSSLQDLLRSPLFSTRSGISRLVGRSTAQGWIPTTIIDDSAGRRSHEWITPRIDRARFTQLRITTVQGRLRSIETDDGFRLSCQYGKADEIQLRPPAWPRGRQSMVDKQGFGIAMISKALPALMEIRSSD